MRKESSTTSLAYSEASILAMPASTSMRLPVSFRRAALTIMVWMVSTLVAISARRNSTAWWSAICLPKVLRCWA